MSYIFFMLIAIIKPFGTESVVKIDSILIHFASIEANDADFSLSKKEIRKLEALAKLGRASAARRLAYYYGSIGNFAKQNYWYILAGRIGDCRSAILFSEHKSRPVITRTFSKKIIRKCNL